MHDSRLATMITTRWIVNQQLTSSRKVIDRWSLHIRGGVLRKAFKSVVPVCATLSCVFRRILGRIRASRWVCGVLVTGVYWIGALFGSRSSLYRVPVVPSINITCFCFVYPPPPPPWSVSRSVYSSILGCVLELPFSDRPSPIEWSGHVDELVNDRDADFGDWGLISAVWDGFMVVLWFCIENEVIKFGVEGLSLFASESVWFWKTVE